MNPALSLLMKHLVIGQRQKSSLISRLFIGHHTVVWFPLVSAFRNYEGSTFIEKDRNKPNYR